MKLYKEKQKEVFGALKEKYAYKNVMQTPKIEKIVVSAGTGKRANADRHWNDFVKERLALITGQKASTRAARISIASFKLREGDPVGQIVTLRGENMVSFFDKLVNITLPRTKDFRGIKPESIDEMGNLTLGIKEHAVFPETSDEEIKNIFGLSITIVTNTNNPQETKDYLEFLGFPFKKNED